MISTLFTEHFQHLSHYLANCISFVSPIFPDENTDDHEVVVTVGKPRHTEFHHHNHVLLSPRVWAEYWPLIGQYRSRDQNTGL